MSVVMGGRSATMTAANDSIDQPLLCSSVRLVGTGMTPGTRLLITTRGTGGKTIIDHYVIAANEDADVFFACAQRGEWIDRPFLKIAPTGTFTVLFRLL